MVRKATLRSLAENTPATRDRYVDLVRLFSIAVVVFGHWLMAVIYVRDGSPTGVNALDLIPGLWLATWVLQVMPLFFMVGGFSNLVAWRSMRDREGGFPEYLRTRAARLMRPTLVFVVVWSAIATIIRVIDPGVYSAMSPATEILAKPLWFLAVYILVVAVAPAMADLHERFGIMVLGFLAIAAILVDVARIGLGFEYIGYLNFAFVWMFVHQLGFHYADGGVKRLTRGALIATSIVSLTLLAVLTGSGIYSPSMVGMASEAASNNSPPSICLIVLSLWLGSAALLVRPAATRWLQRTRVWMGVIAGNAMIMTVFLWHLTALLIGVLLLYPVGFPQPEGGSALWWAWRPVWLLALSTILIGLVAGLARFEKPKVAERSQKKASIPAFIFGTALLIAGLAGIAQYGFAHPDESLASPQAIPLVNAALVLTGCAALRAKPAGG